MAEADVETETNEVMVTGNLIPTQEFDRVKNSVCLLIPGIAGDTIDGEYLNPGWRASGFYAKLKLGSKQIFCIMTNYHVFHTAKESNGAKMLAVFNHESKEELSNNIELPLVPFKLIAKSQELDYILIHVDSEKMKSLGIEPILADGHYVPSLSDNVYIIQHPKGHVKHFSSDRIRRITPPFIEYFADTKGGSSGSPVFVASGTKFHVVALHCKGVELPPENWNKGVLIRVILQHLTTGKYILSLPEIPAIAESGFAVPNNADTEKSKKVVTDEDIRHIHLLVLKVWQPLGRALEVPDHHLDTIELNNQSNVNEKSYQMFKKWKQIKDDQATYDVLADALKHPTVAREDLISKFCS